MEIITITFIVLAAVFALAASITAIVKYNRHAEAFDEEVAKSAHAEKMAPVLAELTKKFEDARSESFAALNVAGADMPKPKASQTLAHLDLAVSDEMMAKAAKAVHAEKMAPVLAQLTEKVAKAAHAKEMTPVLAQLTEKVESERSAEPQQSNVLRMFGMCALASLPIVMAGFAQATVDAVASELTI